MESRGECNGKRTIEGDNTLVYSHRLGGPVVGVEGLAQMLEVVGDLNDVPERTVIEMEAVEDVEEAVEPHGLEEVEVSKRTTPVILPAFGPRNA